MTQKRRLFPLLFSLLLGILLSVFLSFDFAQAGVWEQGVQLSLADRLLASYHNFGSERMALPLLLAGLVYFAGKAKEKTEQQKHICLFIVSCVFSLLNTFGQQMYAVDHLMRHSFGKLLMALYAVSCSVVFYAVGLLLFDCLPKLTQEKENSAFSSKKAFWLAFCIILLGWIPWMISYYPFSADWDVYYPIQQYLGMEPRSNHHPWFYCITVGFFYSLGLSMSDKNIGIFLYVLIRALAMAAIYAGLSVKLKKRGVRPVVFWGVVLFYALVPVWGAYAKHGFKDTITAALFCWYITETIETVECIKRGERETKTYLLYALSALTASLYRNNCIFVAAPVTVLLLIAVLRSATLQKQKLRVCAMIASGVIVFGGYLVYIFTLGGVASGPVAEALAIPLQQTARTVKYHPDEITPEEREAIDSVLAFDQLAEKYDPLTVDPVKWTGHDMKTNLPIYLKTWFSMFFKYPVDYLEAALGQSYGYYAFTGDQALYAGSWNSGMTIFDWVKDPRFDDAFTCDYIDAFAGTRLFLDNWAKVWHELPLLGLTDMKAVYTWLIVLLGVLMVEKKRWIALIPIFGCLLMVLTCCASPVNDCFRYFAPVAAASPACLLLVCPRKEEA